MQNVCWFYSSASSLIIVRDLFIFFIPNANAPLVCCYRHRMSLRGTQSRPVHVSPGRSATVSRARCRWVNGPTRRGEWRAKELVDGFPLWRVLGNPSMGNLFVKNRPLSEPPSVRRRDGNNNINLPPPPVVIYVINLFSTLPVLLPPRSNYPVCLVLCFLFFFHYYLFILFFSFPLYSPSTYQLNSNGFCLNDERRSLRINIKKKKIPIPLRRRFRSCRRNIMDYVRFENVIRP